MPGPDRPAIDVSGLVVRYGSRLAVDRLDLRVHAGEVVALLGRNGAGKTSTVETLEGYRPSAEGDVTVLGFDPRHPGEHQQLTRRMGVMLQRGGVYPSMGPAEAISLFARYYDDPEEPAELVDRLGLAEVVRTPWRRLSGGEQQRLSLALALVGRPAVAFLDEPTAGVDPQGRQAIRGEMESLRARGAAVLVTTHELQEAERVADRIVIIDRGRVVAAGSAAELTTSAGAPPAIRFAAPPGLDRSALGAALGHQIDEAAPGRYVVAVATSGTPAVVARLTAWLAEHDVTLGELQTGGETLEEVFLRVTSTGEADAPPRTAARGRRGRR